MSIWLNFSFTFMEAKVLAKWQGLDLSVTLFQAYQQHQCCTNVTEAFMHLQNAEQRKPHITFRTHGIQEVSNFGCLMGNFSVCNTGNNCWLRPKPQKIGNTDEDTKRHSMNYRSLKNLKYVVLFKEKPGW